MIHRGSAYFMFWAAERKINMSPMYDYFQERTNLVLSMSYR